MASISCFPASSSFRASTLGLAVLGMLAVAAKAPAGLPPQQAVVFDGSASASNTFLVSLSTSGLQADLGALEFQCPGSGHVSPGGVVTLGPAQMGVFPSAVGLASEITAFITSPPELPLLALLGANDDCDLIAVYSSIPPYLDQAVTAAQANVNAVDACLSTVEQAYCAVVLAVESAVIGGEPNFEGTLGLEPAGDLGVEVDSVSSPLKCNVIVEKLLAKVPFYLQRTRGALAGCEGIHSSFVNLASTIGDTLTPYESSLILSAADSWLASAQTLPTVAQIGLAVLDSLRSEITLAAVQNSCARCPNGAGRFLPSQSISLEADAGVLSTIAEAFQSASVSEPDADLAARYFDIATRMDGIPSDRVLHLTHPTGKAVGSHTVALRDPAVPDEGVSPLAVVITAETGGGSMNFMDGRIVLGAWRVLGRTLDPTASLPDDEDDDNDGVRDVHETNTGQMQSRTDTGTNPLLFDTDGDLFSDGVEVDTGSDPGDPGSTPSDLVTGIPEEGAPVQPALWLLGPNPTRLVVRIGYRVSQARPTSLEVHDVGGRLVRRLLGEYRPSGIYYDDWDLRAENGRRVASGIYFIRLRLGGETAVRRIAVVRQ